MQCNSYNTTHKKATHARQNYATCNTTQNSNPCHPYYLCSCISVWVYSCIDEYVYECIAAVHECMGAMDA